MAATDFKHFASVKTRFCRGRVRTKQTDTRVSLIRSYCRKLRVWQGFTHRGVTQEKAGGGGRSYGPTLAVPSEPHSVASVQLPPDEATQVVLGPIRFVARNLPNLA